MQTQVSSESGEKLLQCGDGGCRWGFVNVGWVEAPAQHTPASWAPVFMTLLPTSCELSRARAPEHLCCGLRATLQNYLMDSLTHQYWTFDCPKPDLGKRKENQPLFFIRSCDQNCHPFLTWAQASRSAGPPVLPIQVITELSGFSLCSSLTLFTVHRDGVWSEGTHLVPMQVPVALPLRG